MYFWTILLILFLASLPQTAIPAQNTPEPAITAPVSGDALQGVVEVIGTSRVEGFQSVEISYTYESSQDVSWFLLAQGREPVENDRLATWDTTTIADGNYRLRMRIAKRDGSTEEVIVTGLRVRNYTLQEIPAVLPGQGEGTPAAAPAPQLATPTMTAENPAIISNAELGLSMVQGVVFTLVLFALFGFYAGIRSLFKGR